MTEHAPKVAALEAYRSDLLSAQGERRLEHHLEGCEPCRRTLAAMHAYDELAQEVRASEGPEVDWSKMELSLAREARTEARKLRAAGRDGQDSGARRGLALGLLAAAAVLAVVAAWPREAPHATREAEAPRLPAELAQSEVRPTATEPAEAREGEVTAVIGTATRVGDDGERRDLDVGATLAEGARLQTADRSEVHVRLGTGTGLVAHEQSTVSLATLDAQAVGVQLEAGAVSSEVAPLEVSAGGDPTKKYEVQAGAWAVRVKGTRFVVARNGDDVDVAVDEGTVEVLRDGEVVRVLEAPGRWSSRELDVETRAVRPHGLAADARDWAVLRLAAHEQVARWHVEPPVDYEAEDRIAMRVPADEIGVRARGRSGEWHRLTVRVEDGEASLDEAQLDALARALSGPAQGTLAPEEIRPVVRQARPALQRCHERLMKDRPDLGGKAYRLQLRVTVGRSGVVQRTALETGGEQPPAELERCIEQELKRRPFPEPTGGPVTFEVPLRFQPRSVP